MFPHAEMRPQTQMVIMMMWICKKKITHICTSLNIYHISSSGSYSKYRCSDVIHYLTTTFLSSSVRQWKTPGEPQKPHCDVHAPGCFNTLSVHSFIVPAAQTPPPLPPKVGIYASSPKNKITHTYGFKYVCTCVFLRSPKSGRAPRKVWQGRMTGWGSPAACRHPPLSSGPLARLVSDPPSIQDPHVTLVHFLTFTHSCF